MACLTPTYWRLWVPPDLPEGRRGYPSYLLTAYRGKPLAAASSSSRPFLEVLIGTGASEARSLVGDLRWVQRPRGFFFFVDAVVGISFSCIFSFFSFGRDCAASAPAPIVGCIGWLLCIQSGGKLFFGIRKERLDWCKVYMRKPGKPERTKKTNISLKGLKEEGQSPTAT